MHVSDEDFLKAVEVASKQDPVFACAIINAALSNLSPDIQERVRCMLSKPDGYVEYYRVTSLSRNRVSKIFFSVDDVIPFLEENYIGGEKRFALADVNSAIQKKKPLAGFFIEVVPFKQSC